MERNKGRKGTPLKKFEAWCNRCEYFTLHIEIIKNNQKLVMCVDCKTWSNIKNLVKSVKIGKCRQLNGKVDR